MGRPLHMPGTTSNTRGHDLSTDTFIIALKNFMNRRGFLSLMRSDNGKTFVGAHEESKRFNEGLEVGRIQDEVASKGVQWFLNCPANPSASGVWSASSSV